MPEPDYDIDELTGSMVSEPPVIDVLVKSWIAELDTVYSAIQTTGLRFKLETAGANDDGTNDLDDIFGPIFHIKRFAGETDLDYRARLIVHTRVLMGSGTIPNCEAIIDSLIGVPGGSTIESRWPGVNHITFKDITTLKAAQTALDKIERVLPSMLAAGMSYDMLFAIDEYTLSLILKCNAEKSYDLESYVQDSRFFDYDLDAKLVQDHSQTYLLDMYAKTSRIRTYNVRCGVFLYFMSLPYTLDALLKCDASIDYSLTARFTRNGARTYSLVALMFEDRSASYDLRAYLQRVQRKFYHIEAGFEVT